MASFAKALPVILAHEGGYSNDPHDSGGATNYGVSLRYLWSLGGDVGDFDEDGDVDADDIRAMSPDDAANIYASHWWDRYGYDRIVSQAVATKVFDLAVNMGARQAHKLLQQALMAVGTPVKVDGLLGPETIAATNISPSSCLLAALRSEAAGRYRELIARNPTRAKWERGWLRRAYS